MFVEKRIGVCVFFWFLDFSGEIFCAVGQNNGAKAYMYPVHSTTVSSLLFFVILCLLNVNLVQSGTADFLQSENNTNTTTLNSPITFVWVNLILVSGTVGFVLIPMFYLAFKHMSEIVKTHSTISSYCADPISNTHANRGLLAATCLFGTSVVKF